jgi:hypothetical protein
MLKDRERNFVEGDGNPTSAIDPNNERRLLDNSGHGTGTLSILAGRPFAPFNVVLGGASDADIVPLRVADSVVLLRTSALARALVYAIEQQCDVITMSMGGLPTQAWPRRWTGCTKPASSTAPPAATVRARCRQACWSIRRAIRG